MINEQDLFGMFSQQAKKTPTNLALWVSGVEYSYEELLKCADRVNDVLQDIEPGYCVILMDRSVNTFASILACLKLHFPYVPLNINDKPARKAELLKILQPRMIVTDDDNMEDAISVVKMADIDCYIVNTDSYSIKGPNSGKKSISSYTPVGHIEDLAYLLFTSGTTSVPKCVKVSHSNVLAYLHNARQTFKPDDTDRFSQIHHLTTDYHVHEIYLAWSVGASIHVFPAGDVFVLPRLIKQQRISHWSCVPTVIGLFSKLKLLKESAFSSIRTTVFSGEALPCSFVEAWRSAAPNTQVINMYGPTETTVTVTSHQWRQGESSDWVPIGKPYSDVDLRIDDKNFNDVANGDSGELMISGPQVASGYLKQGENTKEMCVSIDGVQWYLTGDIVTKKDGYLIYRGRIDSQMKVRGYRIGRQEVEALLRKVTGCDQVAVVPWPQLPEGNASGLTFFVGSSHDEEKNIAAKCREVMPQEMWPSRVIVDDIPTLSSNNKIDYPSLEKRLKAANG